MILSRHFVFIHVPKTGGVFVEKLLREYSPADWDVKAVPGHQTIGDIPSQYRSLPVFGFVRNPWDWYVSLYEYLKRDGQNEIFNGVSDHGRKGFKETLLSLFDIDIIKDKDMGAFTLQLTASLGSNQDGVRTGRFESLRQELFDIIGHTAALSDKLIKAIRELPPANVGIRSRYQDYYDAELRDMSDIKSALSSNAFLMPICKGRHDRRLGLNYFNCAVRF